jgi:hypothetical protein
MRTFGTPPFTSETNLAAHADFDFSIHLSTRSWECAITHSADAESGRKFIANERGVEPREADNLG